MRSSVRLLLYSQLALWAFLAVCVLLMPHFLFESDEGGVSNYGVYVRTIIPYTLALGVGGLLMIQAARTLPNLTPNRRQLQWVFGGLGVIYLLALESTYYYQVNPLFDVIHEGVGVVLYVMQLVVAVWIEKTFARDALRMVLFITQLAGFCLLLLTVLGYVHLLFVAEAVTGMSFGALLVRAFSLRR